MSKIDLGLAPTLLQEVILVAKDALGKPRRQLLVRVLVRPAISGVMRCDEL